ncbi:MAG: hypothetical protein ACLRFE_03240 [Clostridia bacterium]
MKINNSRIFTADVYRTTNLKTNIHLDCGGVQFGSTSYDEKLLQKQVVVVKFGSMYVPVEHISSIIKYMDINSHVTKNNGIQYPDDRFLPTSTIYNGKFVKNIQPLFSYQGKTPLKELLGIQKLNAGRDDTYSGGMEL